MTTRNYVLLAIAGLFLSAPLAVTAQAATAHRKPMHHATRSMHHGMSGAHRGRMPAAAATGADHSADSLNAQSLTRTQSAQ